MTAEAVTIVGVGVGLLAVLVTVVMAQGASLRRAIKAQGVALRNAIEAQGVATDKAIEAQGASLSGRSTPCAPTWGSCAATCTASAIAWPASKAR